MKGDWQETPRWKHNPKRGSDPEDIYARPSEIPIPAFPRFVHGPKLTTKKVADDAAYESAKAAGWTDHPHGETWRKGDQMWTIHTLAERQIMLEQNKETRMEMKKGALPDDPDLFWVQVADAAVPDDGGEPVPVKRGPGRPRSVN